MYELEVESRFDSAHNLRGYEGACESLHGHTYRVKVFLQGSDPDAIGMLVDFKKVKSALGEVIEYLDHRYLNELPEFLDENPTAEHLARFIYRAMREKLGAVVVRAKVWETPTSAASYWEND